MQIIWVTGLLQIATFINNLRDMNYNILNIVELILNVIAENFKFHFLPLGILAFLSKDKSIFLWEEYSHPLQVGGELLSTHKANIFLSTTNICAII